MNAISNRLTALLGVEHPIIQDGLGPFQTDQIAAAVSAAGGLGTVSIPGMTEEPHEGARLLRAHIERVADLTDKPFAVNVPVGRDSSGRVLPAAEAYIREVIAARKASSRLERQLRVLTTSAGFPGEFRHLIAESGIVHMHKVGSTAQARKAEASGVDVVIASGYEMGGHTHARPVHTFVLVPNVTASVSVPVVLSGGARDGRTLAAALTLGAEGIAMGTRFIASKENDWHPAYTAKILAASEGDDLITSGVYGPLRVLQNAGFDHLVEMIAEGRDDAELSEWKDKALIRAQSSGDVTGGLVTAGQVASAISDVVRISEFVPSIVAEALEILQSLAIAPK